MELLMKCEQSESSSPSKQMNNKDQTPSLNENSPNKTKIKIINEYGLEQPIGENEINNYQAEIDMFKFSQPISKLIQDKNKQYEGLSKLVENDSGAGSVAFFEAVKMFKFKIQGNIKKSYEQISHQAVNKENEQTYKKTKEMVEMEKINFMSSNSKLETIIKTIVKGYDEEREQEFEKMKPKLLQDFNEAQVNNTKLTKINNIFKALVKQTFLECKEHGLIYYKLWKEYIKENEKIWINVLMKKKDSIKLMDQKIELLGQESKTLVEIIELKNSELLELYENYVRINAVLEALISVFQKQNQDYEYLKENYEELNKNLELFLPHLK